MATKPPRAAADAKRKAEVETLGTISDDKTYPLEVFQKTAGLGKHSMSQLRRQGLRVHYCGNRAFVRGRDFSEFLARLSPPAVVSPAPGAGDPPFETKTPDAA